MINWDIDKEDLKLVKKIAERAARDLTINDRTHLMMDLTACHMNGNPLRLEELLKASEFDFAHDIYGIEGHMNRNNGKLKNGFLPRYSK